MKIPFYKWSAKGVAPLIIIYLIFTSCVTNSHDDHDHDHDEAYGLVIYDITDDASNQPVVTQTLDGVNGTITLDANPHLYELFFLDDHDHEFIPDLSEHTIEITSKDENTLIKIEHVDEKFQDNQFKLTGLESGSAEITVVLKHQGSKEFVSNSLPVEITLQE